VAPTTAPPVAAKPGAPQGRAPTQTYAVGVRQLSLNRGGSRPLRTVIWYPANGGAGGSPRTNAAAASGRFPLVLFSHGLTSSPEAYQGLTTKFAAAGFVVAAPAYPFTSAGVPTYNPGDMGNQPADASYVITEVLKLDGRSGDLLAGHLDRAHVGAGGHSAGGYTTVGMLSGGGRDTRLRGGFVLSGGGMGGAFSGASTPVLFVHGDNDKVVTYATGRAVYTRLTWPKAFLTIVGGDHVAPVVGGEATSASARTMLDFLRYALYGDAAAKSRLRGDATISGRTTYETTL
jgi:fermentation-respiration switch protein FrsA (DUF1100 family)